MKRSNDFIILVLLYSIGIIFGGVILRYVVYYSIGLCPDAPDKFVVPRVFFSGPILLIVGLVLLVKFKRLVHRLFGLLFLAGGVIWMVLLAKEIIEEAA